MSYTEKYKNGHPMFYKLLEEIAELHDKKNAQYATKNDPLGAFKRNAIIQGKLYKDSIKNKELACALSFMGKQIDGVYDMVGEGKTDTPDSLKDKLQDIAVYSLLSIILIEEENKNKPMAVPDISRLEWWEMIDWNTMGNAFDKLPEDIRKKIRDKELIKD